MKLRMDSVLRSCSQCWQALLAFDWQELADTEAMGTWPGPVKGVLALGLLLACLGFGYGMHVRPLQQILARVADAEADLWEELEFKAGLAANLSGQRQQMAEMEASFTALLRQLPDSTQVPGLLEDISFVGQSSGLDFKAIQLQAEVARGFYGELPISIEVRGSYHDFGTFVSGVASLSRIVTLHDFSIDGLVAGPGELSMVISARTYRYTREED